MIPKLTLGAARKYRLVGDMFNLPGRTQTKAHPMNQYPVSMPQLLEYTCLTDTSELNLTIIAVKAMASTSATAS